MIAPAGEQGIQDRPIPPRYWWLRRVGLFALAYVAFVVGLRLYAGWKTERMLEEEIAALRARGVPILPEDFNRPAVPDEQNGAILIQQAAAAFVNGPLEQIPPGTPAEIRGRFMSILGPASFVQVIRARADELAPILEANREALDLIRQARGRPEVDFDLDVKSPMINIPLGPLSDIRILSRLLRVNALYEHHIGNHAEAIECVFDGELLAQSLYRGGGGLIDSLTAIAANSTATDAIESIAPTLRVADTATSTDDGKTPASRVRVETLIRQLLAEDYVRAGFSRAMR